MHNWFERLKSYISDRIEYGSIDPDLRDFMNAIKTNDLDKVKHCIYKIDDINYKLSHNQTPLYYAAKYGNANLVKYLLSKGADPTISDQYGVNPLIIAAQRNDIRMLQVIIAKGGKKILDAKNPVTGETALLRSLSLHNEEAAQMLITAGADLKAQLKNGKTAIDFINTKGFDATRNLMHTLGHTNKVAPEDVDE